MSLSVTLLGTGTSAGVPLIGCDCAVCTSRDPRNRRLRCGALIEIDHQVVLIDTPTDLRQQVLTHAVERVDAVLYTHAHADHLFGADELRVYSDRQRGPIPCYGSAATLAAVRRSLHYVFDKETKAGGGKPRLELHPVAAPFDLAGRRFVPVPVDHGALEVFGYRCDGFAYVTDCHRIPAASRELLAGVEVLVLDALRYLPHPSHFTVAEAIAEAGRIGAARTYLTHLSHAVDHAAPAVPLPPGVELAYDGLRIELR